MRKRRRKFERIEEYQQRFWQMPSDEIQKRLNFGALVKEAQIALREVLEQRGSARDQQEALSPEAMSEENSRQPSFIGPKGNQASTLARRARRTRH